MSIQYPDTQIIGSQEYGFKFILNNQAVTSKPIPLRKQGVIDLLIVEKFDYLEGPPEGWITVRTGGEALENDEFDNTAGDPLFNALFSTSYVFRNDGRDELDIEIKPIAADGGELSDDVWLIKYSFIIRDTEDIKSADNITKAKKFYLWDKNYQLLREKNVTFSTATAIAENVYQTIHATDDERTLPTGTAMLQLLKQNGFEDFVIEEEFDPGSTKIFHTSTPNGTMWMI